MFPPWREMTRMWGSHGRDPRGIQGSFGWAPSWTSGSGWGSGCHPWWDDRYSRGDILSSPYPLPSLLQALEGEQDSGPMRGTCTTCQAQLRDHGQVLPSSTSLSLRVRGTRAPSRALVNQGNPQGMIASPTSFPTPAKFSRSLLQPPD